MMVIVERNRVTASDQLKKYYERTSHRFWDPTSGLVGRDEIVFPLINGLGGAFLEYGCGAGSLLLHVARQQQFTSAIGVDISDAVIATLKAAIRTAEPIVADKITLLQPVDDQLPTVPTGSIDVIVSVATLEHVLDPYVVLDELHRVARPGATLVCSVPNYAYLKHRIRLLFGELPRTGTDEPVECWRAAGWDGMHLHTFTAGAFDILLRGCGWLPVRWTGWGTRFSWLGPLRQRFPGLLSGEVIAVCDRR